MKKLLLSMAAVLGLSLTANAGWFVSGAFNGWSHCNANYELTATDAADGVYSCYVGEIAGEFTIVAGEVSNPDWSTKIGTNGTKVQEGVAYEYVAGADNFVVDGVINNAALTLDTNAGTILLEGTTGENEYDTVYIVGNLGDGWDDARTDYPMSLSASSGSLWTATYTLTAIKNYIKLRAGNYIYATGGGDVEMIVNGPAYTASQTGNAFVVGPGTYTFTFDLAKNADTGYFQISGVAEEVEDEVAIAGAFNGWSACANSTKNIVDGVATIIIPEWSNYAEGLTSGFKVVYNGGWYTNSSELVNGEETVLTNDGSNMTLPYDAEGQTVTFIVNINGGVVVTAVYEPNGQEEPEPQPIDLSKLYIVGEFNGWTTNAEDCLMTKVDNVYSIVLEDGISGEWKICNGTWDWSFGMGESIDVNVETECWYNSQANFSGIDTTGSVTTITFTLVEGSAVEGSNIPSYVLVSVEAGLEGDIDGDGVIGISDISALIDMVVSGEFNPAGDLDNDGQITIADISAIIDLMLK